MRIINSRLCMIVADVTFVASAAFAQATSPAPNEITPGAKPTENMSKELSQSNGIIHPKEVDPAIQNRPPTRGETPTSCPRQGLQAALPPPSQNKRRVSGPVKHPLAERLRAARSPLVAPIHRRAVATVDGVSHTVTVSGIIAVRLLGTADAYAANIGPGDVWALFWRC
jgi:hypothetical protein